MNHFHYSAPLPYLFTIAPNLHVSMQAPHLIHFSLSITNGFKLFDQNLALTGGQPFVFQPDGTTVKTTEMLALNIYNTFYARSGPQWKGIGQAKAVIFAIVVIAIALVQLKATRSKEVQA